MAAGRRFIWSIVADHDTAWSSKRCKVISTHTSPSGVGRPGSRHSSCSGHASRHRRHEACAPGQGSSGLTAETIAYGPIAVPHRITSVTRIPVPRTAWRGPARSGAAAVDRCRRRHQRRLNLSASMRKSATTSRPEGSRTRTISLRAQVASGKWRSAVLQRTAEKVADGKGRCWASARTNAVRGSRPASAWACWSITGEVSTPSASSTVAAAVRTAAPVAQPTSKNWSLERR
jgi:hypothetical protein